MFVLLAAASPAASQVTSREIAETADISGVTASPDGKWIAYRIERPSTLTNRIDVDWYLVAADGKTSPRKLGRTGTALWNDAGVVEPGEAKWTPDSKQIVVRALIDGRIALWSSPVDGSGFRQLAAGDGDIEAYEFDSSGLLVMRMGPSRDLIAPTDAAQADLDALLPHVDLFMPSLAEVRALAGTDDPVEGAHRFIARGAGGCLVKMGAKGALLVLPELQVHAPAHRIDPVDTTSCGDSLCAGFLTARRRGMDEASALRFAVATAAQVALGVGTLGRLDGYDSTLAFMRDVPTTGEAR
ncbi:MAG: hypothetical protein IBJ13_14305 [Sphingopyxis sp.]|nr:hypothetical protein [Sphingopyxis sp.]